MGDKPFSSSAVSSVDPLGLLLEKLPPLAPLLLLLLSNGASDGATISLGRQNSFNSSKISVGSGPAESTELSLLAVLEVS